MAGTSSTACKTTGDVGDYFPNSKKCIVWLHLNQAMETIGPSSDPETCEIIKQLLQKYDPACYSDQLSTTEQLKPVTDTPTCSKYLHDVRQVRPDPVTSRPEEQNILRLEDLTSVQHMLQVPHIHQGISIKKKAVILQLLFEAAEEKEKVKNLIEPKA